MKNIEKFLPIPITILVLISLSLFVTGGIATMLKILLIFTGVSLATFLFCWYVLAPRNRWFTFVPEGTAKAIIRGDAAIKMLIQWNGRTFDKQGDVIPEDEEHKEPRHLFGGFRFYSLFHPVDDLYIYSFEWFGVKGNGEVEHHPKEILDYIMLKDDVYWMSVENAEDKDGLPITIQIILTLRIVNPRKALFDIQNWLETVINRTEPFVRDFITTDTYLELIKKTERLGSEIEEKLEDVLKEFKSRYGVEVRKIEVRNIEPPDDYRQDTLRKFLAERKREEVEILASAEAKRIETTYKAIENFGDLGKLIITLESMEKSNLTTSMVVQLVPGLQEVLKGAFSKSLEEITKDDIRELKDLLKK